jgi:hypothetical protein
LLIYAINAYNPKHFISVRGVKGVRGSGREAVVVVEGRRWLWWKGGGGCGGREAVVVGEVEVSMYRPNQIFLQ